MATIETPVKTLCIVQKDGLYLIESAISKKMGKTFLASDKIKANKDLKEGLVIRARILNPRPGLYQYIGMTEESAPGILTEDYLEFSGVPAGKKTENLIKAFADVNEAKHEGERITVKINEHLKQFVDKMRSFVDDYEVSPVEFSLSKEGLSKNSFWIGEIYAGENVVRCFRFIDQILDEDGYYNLLLTGPSGAGKTSLAEAFAAETNRHFYRFNCGLLESVEEMFIQRRLIDGNTFESETPFASSMERGNTVVLLDEINRAKPYLLNGLFSVLDHARSVQIFERTFNVAPNTLFVATANIGFEYAGTFSMDAALKNRMDMFIEVDYPEKEQEILLLENRRGIDRDSAHKIVMIAAKLREHYSANDYEESSDVSPRSTLKIARLVAVGASIRESFRMVLGNNSKTLVDVLNTVLGVE